MIFARYQAGPFGTQPPRKLAGPPCAAIQWKTNWPRPLSHSIWPAISRKRTAPAGGVGVLPISHQPDQAALHQKTRPHARKVGRGALGGRPAYRARQLAPPRTLPGMTENGPRGHLFGPKVLAGDEPRGLRAAGPEGIAQTLQRLRAFCPSPTATYSRGRRPISLTASIKPRPSRNSRIAPVDDDGLFRR